MSAGEEITQSLLKKHKWGDLELRKYQLEGVSWMMSCYCENRGCILSDEMGLGKTCQTIALLTMIKGRQLSHRPHLIVCPRSVLENWEQEINRFSPTLDVRVYIGTKETRGDLANSIKKSLKSGQAPFDIFLTTYEICLKDHVFMNSIPWNVLVVDEGHRMKNRESLLYKTLQEWDIDVNILLTGTPLQNNLSELYSLLSLVDSSKFKLSLVEDFVEKFSSENRNIQELHDLLAPYLLRRTKADVLKDLPEKKDIVLYHGLSAVQKKVYKAILTKDLDVFETRPDVKPGSLMNILMHLRKCVNHPYLFDGVEPEPFVAGEHLVEASHKLVLIDQLLASLHANGHKVLLFSQMNRMLDILQDYLTYRGYMYERLDGSVRGEERFLAVQNFNANDDTFAFLLSTRAGGQGLNLTAADTVIFVDSDFNPQCDLQAAARAHRIGQDRPVKVIRLIGRNTVEEIVLRRAEAKLKLTDKVIEGGQFSTPSVSRQNVLGDKQQLQDILKFGVEELLADAKADDLLDFESILGASKDGQWVTEEHEDMDTTTTETDPEATDNEEGQSMYMFEGTDYSKEPSAADVKAFDELVKAQKAILGADRAEERTMRRTASNVASLLPLPGKKPKTPLTPEQLEERRKKREEAEERRLEKAKQQKMLRARALQKKREQLWLTNGYESTSVALEDESDDEDDDMDEDQDNSNSSVGINASLPFSLNLDNNDDDEEDDEGKIPSTSKRKKVAIKYVMGDVTHPLDALTDDNIIVHCADDSGVWGQGGLFSALGGRSSKPEELYELAGKMKDLNLGDCHLIPVDDIESREEGRDMLALIVAQERNKRTNKLSGIKLSALEKGLRKVCKIATEKDASVHLPRIGQSTPGFNWYGTERLIQKHLASKGVPTLIYYFPRRHQGQKRKPTAAANTRPSKAPSTLSPTSTTPASSSATTSNNTTQPAQLSAIFTGLTFYLHNLNTDDNKRIRRYILAYDGDVLKVINDSVTHIIASADTDKQELESVAGTRSCSIVDKKWVEDCCNKGKLLQTDEYILSSSM